MTRVAARITFHSSIPRASPFRRPFPCLFRMTRIQATSTSTNSSSSATQPRTPRRIVSTYLSIGRPGTSGFRVCLLRRGRPGHVYAGKWSVVAGSMKDSDASPLAAALREVREETTLREDQTEVLVQGDSFRAEDEKLGVVWEIHPFLMRVVIKEHGDDAVSGRITGTGEEEEEEAAAVRKMIVLDEEHEEMRLVTPEEMNGFDTVDGLQDTLSMLMGKFEHLTQQ